MAVGGDRGVRGEKGTAFLAGVESGDIYGWGRPPIMAATGGIFEKSVTGLNVKWGFLYCSENATNGAVKIFLSIIVPVKEDPPEFAPTPGIRNRVGGVSEDGDSLATATTGGDSLATGITGGFTVTTATGGGDAAGIGRS